MTMCDDNRAQTETERDTDDRGELLRQALITQARIILELQHEVRRLQMVEDLLEGRS